MIPKLIHYCWFGGRPLPKTAKKCIESWRRFFPNYEIIEWNESNFDVNIIEYTRVAYAAKKYAFVSDYARIVILYRYGGIYFDTDVEVIKPMDDILEKGPYMGIETPAKGSNPVVALGLGFAMPLGHIVCKEIINKYETLSFINEDGTINKYTIVPITTDVLIKYGLKPINDIQQVEGIWIYPADYFNPLDSITGRKRITNNTRSIHWYMGSWSDNSRFYKVCSKVFHRLIRTPLK